MANVMVKVMDNLDKVRTQTMVIDKIKDLIKQLSMYKILTKNLILLVADKNCLF